MADTDEVPIGTFEVIGGPDLHKPRREGQDSRPPEVGLPGDNAAPIGTFETILKTPFPKGLPRDGAPASLTEELVRGLGLGTRNVVEGVTSLPTMLADATSWPIRAGQRALGYKASPSPSEQRDALLTSMRLPKPETEGEKQRSEAIAGGAAMLSPMALGAMAPKLVAQIPGAVRPFVASGPASGPGAAAQVAAGGTGAVVGDILANDGRIPDELKPTARMIGNVLGAGGVSGLAHAAGTLKNAIRGIPTELGAALQRLGIEPKTMGAVSDRPGVATLEGMLTKAPLAGDVLRPAQRDTVAQFGNAVERQAGNLNLQADTPKAAGMVVQDALRDWRSKIFPAEQDAVWNPLNQRMVGAGVDPRPYRSALEYAASPPSLATLPENQRAFASAQAKKWLDALDADVPPGGMLTWEQAHALKQRIGDAMGTPDVVASIGDAQLRKIYGGLAQGMEKTATQHGQADLFKKANQVTTEGHQFIEGTLSKGISTPNKLQEKIAPDVATNAMLGDNQALEQLRQRVPEAADAIAAFNLRNAAQAKGSQQGSLDTTSSGSFLTTLRNEQRRRPEGMRALYGDNKQTAEGLDDLLRVAERMREVEHNMNTSGSAGTGQLLSVVPTIAGATWAGGPWAGAAAAATHAAPYTAAKVLTNPMAIRLAGTKPGPRLPLGGVQAGLLGEIPSITVRPEPEDRRPEDRR